MSGPIPRELLQWATATELDEYVDFLESELDAGEREDGAWVLQERQQTAEDALTDLDPTMSHELLYGGAAGPGKTEFALWHGYHSAARFPGLRVLMLRRTFPELRRSLVLRSLERFDRDICRYIVTETTWKFNNGSFIEFGYCETDADVYQYQSAEYDIVIWDELTQWKSAFPYLYLFSRNRSRISTLARGFVPHIIACTNPGNVGGAWVKGRFIDVGPPERRTVHAQTDDDGHELLDDDGNAMYGSRIFIPGRLDDNRFINKRAYSANLANLGDSVRLALMEGSWDVIEGQYFAEWDRKLHVIEPFTIPDWWTRLRCIDYGHFAPWACLWLAFDNDGTAIVYRELYETKLTPVQQAQRILGAQMPSEKVVYTVGDPSMWATTGVGIPIAQQYADNGVPMRKGMNARVSGWARMREYLRPIEVPATARAEARVDVHLKVFSTCTNLIRTLPMLVHDNVNPEDLDSDGEDHAADALRYGLMSRPPLGRLPVQEPSTLEGKLEKARRERALARSGRRGIDHPNLGRI